MEPHDGWLDFVLDMVRGRAWSLLSVMEPIDFQHYDYFVGSYYKGVCRIYGKPAEKMVW